VGPSTGVLVHRIEAGGVRRLSGPLDSFSTGGTDLTIGISNGSRSTVMSRLTCNPTGGTNPDPEAACRALDANGGRTAAAPKDKACTQIYGGPETASSNRH
jgi:hypothetical protein